MVLSISPHQTPSLSVAAASATILPLFTTPDLFLLFLLLLLPPSLRLLRHLPADA